MTQNLKSEIKVVLKQIVLSGSRQPNLLQRIAVVYINGSEYRVLAPPEAKGDALDWVPHFSVRQLVDINSEVEIHDASGVLVVKAVKEELERLRQLSAVTVDQSPPSVSAREATSSPAPNGNDNLMSAKRMNKEQQETKKAFDYLTPASFIAAAKAADPSFKFAILVAGILGIVVSFAKFGVSFATLVFGAIVVIGLMILYLVFAQAAKLAKATLDLPAKILIWTVLVIVVVVLACLTTSVFLNIPLPIRDWIVLKLGTKSASNPPSNPPAVYSEAEKVTKVGPRRSHDSWNQKRPALHDRDESGYRYYVTQSFDANCSQWLDKVAADPQQAEGRQCNFTRPQVTIGGSADKYDHWDIAVQAPSEVYDVDCQKNGHELFEDQTDGTNNQHKGIAEGTWGRCTGFINGGDDAVTVTAYYRVLR